MTVAGDPLLWSGVVLLALSIVMLPWAPLLALLAKLLVWLGQLGSAPVSTVDLRTLWVTGLGRLSLLLGVASSALGAGFYGLLTAILIAFICLLFKRDRVRRERRYQALLVAQLPNHLELIAMLLAAGLPLLTCLQRASGQNQRTALTEQMQRIVNQVKAGDSLNGAMADFASRFPVRELRLFSSAVQHAQQSGAGLAEILFAQAAQRRQELFLRAEQQAMEIPVKLMLPLMLFIFPSTLLVLIVVLAGKLLWQL
ncbi:hypothetical protein CWE12_03690 [Aliidiomarina sedimenti]|uniref:Type II secretion system protein GspF domain-containing protein n=1 Tax=Aliidiomarina sedimenti TaxID=1933879 RepID=A0ABY0C344_9GAMM|nr:type II secretion system F family protein [Aliidiomarina sedimenti]RUO32104.1 hypothetical protein CWE12_03690 [Aliidiomarina sedimenti]